MDLEHMIDYDDVRVPVLRQRLLRKRGVRIILEIVTSAEATARRLRRAFDAMEEDYFTRHWNDPINILDELDL